MNSSEVKQIFLEDDILPLGDFEALPVTHEKDGMDYSYPNVSTIRTDINYESLLEEALIHIDLVGNVYVKDRVSNINNSIEEDTLRNVLAGVGFYKGSYQSYSLRRYGTAELEEWVLPHTRKFFENLPVKTFRQQYAVAFPGWNTKLHRDHNNFKRHGFRAMVPLSADVYMAYEDSRGNPLVYQLKRGGMYFVNIAKMHRGFNESLTKDRINLIMQMDSDKLVNASTPLKTMRDIDMMKLPEYTMNYDVWEFGYEL